MRRETAIMMRVWRIKRAKESLSGLPPLTNETISVCGITRIYEVK